MSIFEPTVRVNNERDKRNDLRNTVCSIEEMVLGPEYPGVRAGVNTEEQWLDHGSLTVCRICKLLYLWEFVLV